MKLLFALAFIALISSIAGSRGNQVVPVIFRDFLGNGYTGPVIVSPRPNPLPTHPDFNNVKKVDTGIVTNSLVNGEPAYAPGATGTSVSTHGQAYFNDWYNPSSYSKEIDSTITFTYVAANSSWTHSSFRNFFPLNGLGWGDQLPDGNGTLQNFGFTMQISNYFLYKGHEYLTVGCDDDCFVYVNGQLVINFGGIHEVETQTIDFTTMGYAAADKVYVDIFYAERHVPWATFNFDTNIVFPGTGGGDPHFTGLSGEKYDFMGQADTWFNLFTDTNFQLNAYFVQGCASKPEMTTMGSVAFLIGDHRIHLDLTCNATLDETINLIKVGTSVPIGKYGMISHVAPQVYIVDTNDYTIRVNPFILDPHYQIEGKPFHGADCVKGYFNVDVMMKNENANPHGILGQTAHHEHTNAELDAKPKSSEEGEGEIEGVYTDYIVSGMYATDNKFSRYTFNPNVADYVAPKSKREVAFDPLEHTYQELVKFMEDSCPK